MVTSITTRQPKSWKPDGPTSKGATAFHDAVINASWNHECLDYLISIAEPNIHENDIVVDFGAGTGTSSIRILKKLRTKIRLWLVDNSPAWLGKAYELLSSRPNVSFFILEQKGDRHATLSETVGKESVDSVICANTVHLIPNLKETFKGIADALKSNGNFVFNTGNVTREGREKGVLMLDSTVYRVHDIAIDIIRKDTKFEKYRENLEKNVKAYNPLRKFIFPDPRPLQEYLTALKDAGFMCMEPYYKSIRLKYDDWIKFLRIKRLQTGILPEIGGKHPNPEQEKDRDTLIIMAAQRLFKELEKLNPFADNKSYLGEWIYISATKLPNYKMLKGKTALVTGASRGIGKAIAIEFAKNNANVIINYFYNKTEANEVVEKVKKYGVKSIAVKADVGNFDQVKQMADTIQKNFGKVDILVNNAGIIKDRTLKNMTKEEWDEVINTNLNSVFYVTKAILPLMDEGSRIISISSIIGQYGNFGQCNYAASKAGIIGFTKSLAKELGKKRITVNAVAPGFVKTNITKGIPFLRKKVINYMTPLKEEAEPEDIAYVITFLASDKARYITGSVINIDGGLSF